MRKYGSFQPCCFLFVKPHLPAGAEKLNPPEPGLGKDPYLGERMTLGGRFRLMLVWASSDNPVRYPRASLQQEFCEAPLKKRQTISTREKDASPPNSSSLSDVVSHGSVPAAIALPVTSPISLARQSRETSPGDPRTSTPPSSSRRHRPPRQTASSHNLGSRRSFMHGRKARTQHAGKRQTTHLRFSLGSTPAR